LAIKPIWVKISGTNLEVETPGELPLAGLLTKS